jgi:hypothetical protein
MATIPEETSKIKCFVCGSHAKIEDFGRLGEDVNFLNLCTEATKEGNFKETFLAGMSVRRQIDPTATSMELALTKAIAEANDPQTDEMKRLSRMITSMYATNQQTGKGEMTEFVTAEILRQKFPDDSFDTKQAVAKHGSDIIATVYDRKKEVGKITISVKDTKVWKSDFIDQLEGNMVDDLTKIGLLVSKKMPARTNETGEPRHNNGLVYFIVAPQYMPAIYTALREVVIYKHEQDQFIHSKEQELMEMEFISKSLAKWITGDQFHKMETTLVQIHGHTEETISDCQKSIVDVTKNATKAIKRQEMIQTEILNTEGFLESLADILSPNTKTTKEERE